MKRAMLRAWVVVCGVCLFPSAARAEPPALVWAGPACADSGPSFEAQLAGLVAPAERAKVAGRVSVEARGKRLSLSLSLELSGAPLGERRIEVGDCQTAARTAAVATSLALFSAESAPAVEPKSTRSGAWTLAPEPRPDFTRARRAVAPAVRPELRAGLLGVVDTLALPAPALGAALEVGVGLGRFSGSILGATSLLQTEDVSEGSARLRLTSFAARACYAPLSAGVLRLDTCGGARLLWTWGGGHDFDVNYSGSLLSLGPLVGVDFSVRAPAPLEWRLELEACAPLSRQRFTVRDEELTRLQALTLSGRVGPLVRF